MNWRGAISTSLRAIVVWWYSIAIVIAVAAFVAALIDDDTTGGAGLFAPVVALCTAAIVLGEAVNSRGLQFRRAPGFFVSLLGMAPAYLWIAAEADIHPANPALLGEISLLWILAALATVMMPLAALVVSRQSNGSSPRENADAQQITKTDSFVDAQQVAKADSFTEHVLKPLFLLLAVFTVWYGISHTVGDAERAYVILPIIVAVALVLITQTVSWRRNQERKEYEERIANLLVEIRNELKKKDDDEV